MHYEARRQEGERSSPDTGDSPWECAEKAGLVTAFAGLVFD